MNLVWREKGWEQYLYWQQTDKKMLKKINELVKEIKRNPFEGTGKPEPLKNDFAGCWSRRIDKEHRLVYKVDGGSIFIMQCRFHYDK
jgi:toxin YoeB